MEQYLVREIEVLYKKGTGRRAKILNCPEDINNFFSFLKNKTKECFIVLLMNNKNCLLKWEELSVGTIQETIVHPREIFCSAIREKASAIIVIHNHPTGNTTPSNEDIETVMRLKKASEIIGIALLDSIIIGDGFYSMKENNII